LAKALLRAAKRGVKIVCTNASHLSVRELYSNPIFNQLVVSRSSCISADSASRRSFEELVIQANI
jgi:DNA adenine methylase